MSIKNAHVNQADPILMGCHRAPRLGGWGELSHSCIAPGWDAFCGAITAYNRLRVRGGWNSM